MRFSVERFEAQMAMDRASRNARQRRRQDAQLARTRGMDDAEVALFVRAQLRERGYGPLLDVFGGGASAHDPS